MGKEYFLIAGICLWMMNIIMICNCESPAKAKPVIPDYDKIKLLSEEDNIGIWCIEGYKYITNKSGGIVQAYKITPQYHPGPQRCQ